MSTPHLCWHQGMRSERVLLLGLPMLALCENLGNIRIGLPSPDSAHWFLEPLLSNLPNSLCRIALYFRKSVSSLAIFPPKTTKDREFPKTLENTLTSSKFPKVAYVEIRWDEQITINQFEDNLINASARHVQGVLAQHIRTWNSVVWALLEGVGLSCRRADFNIGGKGRSRGLEAALPRLPVSLSPALIALNFPPPPPPPSPSWLSQSPISCILIVDDIWPSDV